jgi:LuxR family transcriptional regulator, maltose regulon positive regulatory protein
VHPADLSTRFWARIVAAQSKLANFSVTDAAQLLDLPLERPVPGPLPRHLMAALIMARGQISVISGDATALRRVEQQCLREGLHGMAAMYAAFRSDLAGDRRMAAALFARAADDPPSPDPGMRPIALVCEAQLRDVQGEHEIAATRLHQAIIETAGRRNGVAFLGWSRQGTSVSTLLAQSPDREHAAWARALATAAAERPELISVMSVVTLTPQEREGLPEASAPPELSTRQRDVLRELARGSTYADISANLFISENTVKSHVAGLYARLGVRRRSDALALAREWHLL